jgi:hypothetical protein
MHLCLPKRSFVIHFLLEVLLFSGFPQIVMFGSLILPSNGVYLFLIIVSSLVDQDTDLFSMVFFDSFHTLKDFLLAAVTES